MPDSEYRQVSTTTDSRVAAEALAESAVRARVAACAQIIGPIGSVYHWQGNIDTAEEYLILFKTPVDRADALTAHILARHSYEVPEIIHTPVTGGNPAYLRWLSDETRTG